MTLSRVICALRDLEIQSFADAFKLKRKSRRVTFGPILHAKNVSRRRL